MTSKILGRIGAVAATAMLGVALAAIPADQAHAATWVTIYNSSPATGEHILVTQSRQPTRTWLADGDSRVFYNGDNRLRVNPSGSWRVRTPNGTWGSCQTKDVSDPGSGDYYLYRGYC